MTFTYLQFRKRNSTKPESRPPSRNLSSYTSIDRGVTLHHFIDLLSNYCHSIAAQKWTSRSPTSHRIACHNFLKKHDPLQHQHNCTHVQGATQPSRLCFLRIPHPWSGFTPFYDQGESLMKAVRYLYAFGMQM